MVHLDYRDARPIYSQIVDGFRAQITSGVLTPGEKLPSVRELALSAGVNPNTVQKAFDTLEAQGILLSQRGSGWYVSENVSAAKQALEQLLLQKTEEYFSAMQALGMTAEETRRYVAQWQKTSF